MFVLSRLGRAGQRNPMPIADHSELNEACAKSWARRLLDAMYSVGARWLSSAVCSLKSQTGDPIPPAGADKFTHEACRWEFSARDNEAVAIMQAALRRGATQRELACVAVAAARAVLPIIQKFKQEATAVIEAAEDWISCPSEENENAARNASRALNARCGGRVAPLGLATREDWALIAVDTAAMACFSLINPRLCALIAVEFAGDAGGGEVDVASVVTAALL